MSNLHRIHWIDQQVRAGKYPNARKIAEQFEISARQAARDIEYLRYSMGAPLEYDASKNGYYYSDNAFALPSYYVTEEDKRALSFLAQQYRTTRTNHGARLAALFSLLTGEAGQETEKVLGINLMTETMIPIKSDLLRAISEQQKVEMVYENNRGIVSRRCFHPYKSFTRNRSEYVVGFCELKGETRVFRLSRIKELALTGEDFIISQRFSADDYNDDNPFRYLLPYTAEIETDEPPFKGSFLFIKISDRMYQVDFFDSQQLLSALFALPRPFKIHSPNWLREKMLQKLTKILSENT